jgi:hypothetical protein
MFPFIPSVPESIVKKGAIGLIAGVDPNGYVLMQFGITVIWNGILNG